MVKEKPKEIKESDILGNFNKCSKFLLRNYEQIQPIPE